MDHYKPVATYTEERYEMAKETFFEYIDRGFQDDETVEWLSEEFDEFVWSYVRKDRLPGHKDIVLHAVAMNLALAEKEAQALLQHQDD
jgi:hypothetical protein